VLGKDPTKDVCFLQTELPMEVWMVNYS